MCSGIRSSSPQSFPMCTTSPPHAMPCHANSARHQQMAFATISGRRQSSGWERDTAGPEHCSAEMKPVSSGKLGPVENLPPKKRADLIIFEGFAPLPSLADSHPLPKYKNASYFSIGVLFPRKTHLTRIQIKWKPSS